MRNWSNSFTILLLLCCQTVLGQQSFNMTLLDNWDDTSIVASDSWVNNRYNEVWGITQNGKEYAVIGSSKGTHFIDVSTQNATEVAFLEGTNQQNNVIHRDYHSFNNYLYIVADEGSDITLQIVDFSTLPDSVVTVLDGIDLGGNNTINKSHNIFIDTASARLYSASNKLKIYSLQNPEFPTFINEIDFPESVHDMFVHNDTAYVNVGNSGLYIYDCTTLTDEYDLPLQEIPLIGLLTDYPQAGYNHAGWLNPETNLYVMADETHGSKLKLINTSDLNNLEVESTFYSGVDSIHSIAHNVIIQENKVFASYYHDGIYVFNVSNPANPTILGFYDTSTQPNANNFKGCWGVYSLLPSGKILASDMDNGLFVLKLDNVGLSVSENPVNSNIVLTQQSNSLTINTSESFSTLTLYSTDGKIVKMSTLIGNSNSLSLNNIVPGIYFAEVITNKHKLSKHIIIR